MLLRISNVKSIVNKINGNGIIENRYRFAVSRLLRTDESVRISLSGGKMKLIWGNRKDGNIMTVLSMDPEHPEIRCSCRLHEIQGFVCEHMVFAMIFLRDYMDIDERIIVKVFRNGYRLRGGRP